VVFDFTRAFGQAEDFLRRHIKPKAVQEAEKRRRRRRRNALIARFNRGLAVAGTGGAGLIGYGVAVAPVGATGLAAALAATAIAAGATMFWPQGDGPRGKISRAELLALLGDAEEWLLLQRQKLPGRALPALDQIFFRLHDLQPHVAELDPHATLAWDLRRLLADHLPRLVHSYAELPATVRDAEPELLHSLVEGLGTLDEELTRICREVSRDHLVTFQAQERFIETRYRDGDKLRGE
jgi:hypothetical protein